VAFVLPWRGAGVPSFRRSWLNPDLCWPGTLGPAFPWIASGLLLARPWGRGGVLSALATCGPSSEALLLTGAAGRTAS